MPTRRWVVVATVVFLVVAGCGNSGSPVDALSGKVLGGTPDEFGLDASGDDQAIADDGLEVRWNDTDDGLRVVGIAELWTGDQRDAFVQDGGTIDPVAAKLVDRFAPNDAKAISDGVMGGAHYFYYESPRLGAAMAADDELADGRFFVVVNLNPHVLVDRIEPLSSAEEPPTAGDSAERLFTAAIVAGSPWP